MSEPTHNIIVWWWGLMAEIPAGWKVCDGNNNTPDLRYSFIVGAGDTYNPDDSGGENSHAHDFDDGGHVHDLLEGAGMEIGEDKKDQTESTNAVGNTNAFSNYPPWMNLYLIKKN